MALFVDFGGHRYSNISALKLKLMCSNSNAASRTSFDRSCPGRHAYWRVIRASPCLQPPKNGNQGEILPHRIGVHAGSQHPSSNTSGIPINRGTGREEERR